MRPLTARPADAAWRESRTLPGRKELGAGLAVLYTNPDGQPASATDVGANFVFGLGRRGPIVPNVQAKLIAKSDTEFVIGGPGPVSPDQDPDEMAGSVGARSGLC